MHVANKLTIGRIFLALTFILFFSSDSCWSLWICIIIAVMIELSDFLDGRLARRYGQVTDFGKLMDPFADSIARFTIFLCFLAAGWAPVWIVAIFFYRDMLVAIIRVFSLRSGVVVSARKSGKAKAWVQALAIFLVLGLQGLSRLGFLPESVDQHYLALITSAIIGGAALVTLWSAIDYWNANKSMVFAAM
ncbi:MAG TPA: CDP-diacylglycerol--glycerol-3-phosphate 3-phosphatidyltransferase [bacterium]|nr:CDP-diacylglycerol--glycerol-3-phosphate 3-phosphatidyltransferase [bacterium]